jgi:hypothetical protein
MQHEEMVVDLIKGGDIDLYICVCYIYIYMYVCMYVCMHTHIHAISRRKGRRKMGKNEKITRIVTSLMQWGRGGEG